MPPDGYPRDNAGLKGISYIPDSKNIDNPRGINYFMYLCRFRRLLRGITNTNNK